MDNGHRTMEDILHNFTAIQLGFLALLMVGAASIQAETVKVPRPDQYVVLAFDGSKDLGMWQETRDFAKSSSRDKKHLLFTYFINSTYYLSSTHATSYQGPGVEPGRSAIGFGGTLDDVLNRFLQTNGARREGHEIANHAAGHFDGSKWNSADWRWELDQFYAMLFQIFDYNHVDAGVTKRLEKEWTFTAADITGFRAPQLGQNQDLYEALPQYGMQYDTSLTADPTRWPSRNKHGTWSFPLAYIPIEGTSNRTLAMDYNFYFSMSGGKPDLPNAKNYEEQMFYSYVNYFYDNYNGNRAPVNIGHHFSKWNGGAYWKALKRFAHQVCGLPEVQCVTYQELVQFMNQVESQQLLKTYQAGAYLEKTNAPRPKRPAHIQMPQLANGITIDQLMINDPPEAHETSH